MGVLTQIDGACAVVTLDWPEKRNALGPAEATELAGALAGAAAVPEVRGVVLTGNGAFCAGGDINGMIARADLPPEERRRLVYGAYQGLIRAVVDLPVPTFAAVDGPAVGMGFDLALACDDRIVGPDGWFRQGWAGIGLIPGTGGELLLRLRAPGALWRVLPGQPKIGPVDAERAGIAERAERAGIGGIGERGGSGGIGERGGIGDRADARASAVARVRELSGYSRAMVEGYVRLNRAELWERLPAHQAECLAIQIELLADPEFRSRAARAIPGGRA